MRKLIPVVLTLLALWGCGEQPRPRESVAAGAPLPVRVATAESVEWSAAYEATGTVRARTAAVLSSKVMGYVREVRFQTGETVAAGQPLIVLDARDLEAGYRQAEAALAEARSGLPEADNAVKAAQAQVDLATVTFRRMQALFEKKSISNQEFDEAQARLRVAQAGAEMAEARRHQFTAKIRQAEQALASAGIARGYAEIKAPFAGIVTERRVEPGNLAAPGAPLATLEQAGSYRLEVPVEESRLVAIHAGHPVAVRLDALDRSIQARVSEIVPTVDASSRAFLVKIDLPGAPRLRSGLYGRASFPVGSRRVLAIPAEALVEQGQVQSAFAVEDSVARNRLITAGERRQGWVEVLSGLRPGDRVVVSRPPALADGARVEVRP